MLLQELFESLTLDIQEVLYGSWTIKYTTSPKDGKYKAIAISRDKTSTFKVEGTSSQEVINLAKEEINKETQDKQKQELDIKKIIRPKVYFNSSFNKEIFSKQDPTCIKFYRHGNEIFAELANESWFNAYGKDLKDLGFSPIYKLDKSKKDSDAYFSPISVALINKLGLKFHARYVLESMGINSDKNRYFKLIFDSDIYGNRDKVRLHTPAIIITTSNDR